MVSYALSSLRLGSSYLYTSPIRNICLGTKGFGLTGFDCICKAISLYITSSKHKAHFNHIIFSTLNCLWPWKNGSRSLILNNIVALYMVRIGHQFHNAISIIFGDVEFNVFLYILAYISHNTIGGATSITHVRDVCLSNIPINFHEGPSKISHTRVSINFSRFDLYFM